jgi:7-carboxy-7-deazaguanine synthase
VNYKIAEIFHSIQGEGTFTGQAQCFIRLAGCNVGKYIDSPLRVLNPTYSVCTSVLGENFLCDTDYHGVLPLSEVQLIKEAKKAGAKTICITGGEPYLWNLSYLVFEAWDNDMRVHIETSGTLPFTQDVDWITCSPKIGFLEENIPHVNEWKFVVGVSLKLPPNEIVEKIKDTIKDSGKIVYISPINGIGSIDKDNAAFAFEVLRLGDRRWRMNTQIHKILGMR